MGKLILNGKEYIRSIPSPFPPIIYSKEEREVGVWTDGKPLYEITVEISDLNYITALSNKSVYTNQSFDKVISMKGYFSNSAKNRYYNLNYASPDTDKNTIFWYDPVLKTVFFLSDDTWGDSELVITIQYTKTTDTAGSGTWTTQGTLSHHYSTNEQVIGTWIDGKPIYEKSYLYENSSGSPSSSEIVIINDFGTDKQCIPGGLQGMFYNQSSGANYPVPWADVNGSSGNSTGLWVGDGKIKLRTRNDSYSNNYKLRITARYTKTTD